MFSFFAPPTPTRNHSHRSYLFKLFALFALLTVSLSATADTSTLTFTTKCNGSGTTNDGVKWIVTSDGTESDYENVRGIHYGTGKVPVQYIKLSTSGITGTISKIVVNASTAKNVSATVSVTVGGTEFGGTAQSLSSSAADYTFSGSASGEIIVIVTKPSSATGALYVKSITVTYENTPTYALTINEPKNGTISVKNGETTVSSGDKFAAGTELKVTATPATGYAFNGWSADGLTINNPAANPLEFNMPASAVTLTAAFISADTDYSITLTQTTGGTITADKTKAKAGETVTLTATPTQTDYVFTSWTVLDVNKNEITVTNNQFTMPASDVKIEATFTRLYKVTINAPEHGTLAIKNGDAAVESGTHLLAGTVLTITATPDARYKDPVWQYKETGNEEFTTGNGTSFTMNAKDVTFQASFTAREYHNVTFSVNGQESEPTEVEVGASITFPANPDDINDKKFVGWYGAEYSHDTKEPAYVTSAVMGDADVTYYAVFATVKEIAESYAETAIGDLKTNDVMIIVGKSGDNYYALSNDKGTSKAPTAVNVTIQDDKIISTISDNIKWKYSTNGSSYQFKKFNSSTDFLYNINSSTDVRVGSNSNKNFTINNGYLQNTTTNRYLGIYNQQDWRCYATNTGTSNIAGQTFSFYKYIAASRTISDISTTVVPLQAAGIAFAESAVSTPLNSGYTGQTLTNPNSLTVTYTSSNPSVATVNAETGVVALEATGTTTITASFTRNDTYQSAEVSYELTVTPAVHTVTFMVNGTQRSTDIVAEGAAIDFPEVDDIAGKSLAGWRTSALENVTDTEPADMVTSATMPTADVTYYAVFAKATTPEGASNYILDYNDNEETISKLTLGYGSSVEYTAKDGGQWVIKVSKQTGMQINKDRDASIKVPNCSGNITSIAITANDGAQKAVGFSSSDYNGSGTPTYLAWGTDGTSQTLDLSSAKVKTGYIVPKDGNCQITKIVVNYNIISGYCTTVTTGETSIRDDNKDPVSGKYYATYSNTQKFEVPDDVTVAQVVEKNGLIYLERYAAGDVVAANTGVLLESENIITTAFELTNKEATNLGVTNVLKASGAGITRDEMGAADDPAKNYFYRLTTGTLNGETVFGFYWKKTDGSAFDLGANKAYMVLQKSNAQAAPRYVWLGGQTTAIDGLNADTEATVGSDERIYSLDGRRVEGQLKRGIYVKNGKKFIVR